MWFVHKRLRTAVNRMMVGIIIIVNGFGLQSIDSTVVRLTRAPEHACMYVRVCLRVTLL